MRVTSRDLNIQHHIIDGYVVQDNTPSPGSIQWSDVHITYQGITYNITSGYTNYKYVYWDMSVSTTQLVVSDTLPTLTDDDILLFFNKNGIHVTVPKSQVVDGSLIVSESILASAIAASAITADKIAADAITADKLAANAIGAEAIASNVITADKLNVTSLSAISANLGSVTSGTITGATVRTSSGADRLEMSDISFKAYAASKLRVELKSDRLSFLDESGALTGFIWAQPDSGQSVSNLVLEGETTVLLSTYTDAYNYSEFSVTKPFDLPEIGYSSPGGFKISSAYGTADNWSSVSIEGTEGNLTIGGVIGNNTIGPGTNGLLSLHMDLELNNAKLSIPDGTLTVNALASKATLTSDGGLGIGSADAIDAVHGSRRSVQLATDMGYGGTFDNHSGFLIYSIMSTGWGYSELHFEQSNGWGTYDANSSVVFQRAGAIFVKGGSANGYAVRNIDTSQGSRPTILSGRTGSTSGAWVTVTHASSVFKSLVSHNETGAATRFQNVTSTSFQVAMAGTSTGTVDWIRCGQA